MNYEKSLNTGGKKAAALKYNKDRDLAPKILGSGKGIIAEKILEIAKNQDISVYKDPVLVETLIHLDVGQEIPQELYGAVAEILAFIYAVDGESFLGPNSDN